MKKKKSPREITHEEIMALIQKATETDDLDLLANVPLTPEEFDVYMDEVIKKARNGKEDLE